MSGITLATAEAQLALWVSASESVATGQSYRIGTRELTRVNAKEIREMIDYWELKVTRLSGSVSGIKARFAEPVS